MCGPFLLFSLFHFVYDISLYGKVNVQVFPSLLFTPFYFFHGMSHLFKNEFETVEKRLPSRTFSHLCRGLGEPSITVSLYQCSVPFVLSRDLWILEKCNAIGKTVFILRQSGFHSMKDRIPPHKKTVSLTNLSEAFRHEQSYKMRPIRNLSDLYTPTFANLINSLIYKQRLQTDQRVVLRRFANSYV